MIDKNQALRIAGGQTPDGLMIDRDRVKELESGWLFPYRGLPDADPLDIPAGSNGCIINKSTGAVKTLGSRRTPETDAKFYDLGYQFDLYDLVITSVNERSATLDFLEQLRLSDVDLSYSAGVVWRVPRSIARAELNERLSKLPCIFGAARLYFVYEVLAQAERETYCEFRVLKCTG
ncbi:MAG: hypothetical protein RKU31_23745 [Deltaproteobacteria bacterium]|jgi:hypothetical protein